MSLSNQHVYGYVRAYTSHVPKLWTETIETHRREVRDAILETTAAVVAEHGLLAVTMSQIAEETGIGRATLYKYFPDVEAILLAWHDRQLAAHLDHLNAVRDRTASAGGRLEAVLEAYAMMTRHARGPHERGLNDLLHGDARMELAHQQLHDMIRDLIAAAAEAGEVRSDLPPDELASYCISALTAASPHGSKAAVGRLVAVTLDGLRVPH